MNHFVLQTWNFMKAQQWTKYLIILLSQLWLLTVSTNMYLLLKIQNCLSLAESRTLIEGVVDLSDGWWMPGSKRCLDWPGSRSQRCQRHRLRPLLDTDSSECGHVCFVTASLSSCPTQMAICLFILKSVTNPNMTMMAFSGLKWPPTIKLSTSSLNWIVRAIVLFYIDVLDVAPDSGGGVKSNTNDLSWTEIWKMGKDFSSSSLLPSRKGEYFPTCALSQINCKPWKKLESGAETSHFAWSSFGQKRQNFQMPYRTGPPGLYMESIGMPTLHIGSPW